MPFRVEEVLPAFDPKKPSVAGDCRLVLYRATPRLYIFELLVPSEVKFGGWYFTDVGSYNADYRSLLFMTDCDAPTAKEIYAFVINLGLRPSTVAIWPSNSPIDPSTLR